MLSPVSPSTESSILGVVLGTPLKHKLLIIQWTAAGHLLFFIQMLKMYFPKLLTLSLHV